VATRAYSSPGVTVTETVNPSLAPLLANPSVVAIVAEADGEQSASERLILEGGALPATVATALVGANNDLVFTADTVGAAGNDIQINYTDPGGATATLGVVVTGTLITVNLGRAASAINTTATALKAAVDAAPAAAALVNVANSGQDSGAGLVTAMATINLAGGSDAAPQTLKNTGVSTSTVVVKNASSGLTINPGNYAVVAGTDPDASVSGDEPYTISRIASPSGTILIAASGAGALTGTYKYACTFVNATGETGIGTSTSAEVAISAAGYNLTNIPFGDAGTTARNIYRMKTVGAGADNVWHLVATIANNTTTYLNDQATSDVTAAIAAAPPTDLASGDTVVVSYDYTDNFYYEPTLLSDFDDIVDKYGAPYDANGLIDSELSFAARLALINGASEVMCVATAGATSTYFDTALARLEGSPEVRILIVGSGDSTVLASVTSHVTTMNAQGQYRQAIIGRDGSTTAITAATLRAAATATNNEAVQMVSPASFTMQNPVTGRDLKVGGQWAAAALAGMYAGRDVQIPLTRKSVAGFSAINDKRTATELALDSAAGLAVIEDRGGVLRVRHSVTTAVGSVNTREASVVRAKYDMAHRLRDTLDSALVGSIIDSTRAPLVAESIVSGILEQLVIEQAIGGYTDVKGRVRESDPTTIEVKFAYQPAYPINNIAVSFLINTQTGEFALAA
jgi:hypothetical protein